MFVQQIADGEHRLVTSASDLTAASQCEFAFLRRVDARLGRDVVVPPDDDPMLARAARLGDAHEERVLARYIAEFGAGSPGGVVEIARADSRDETALEEAQELTVAALRGGAEVVFQATFFDPRQSPATGEAPAIGFIGYADFLRRTAGGAYEVQDTKLARRAKVTALMQLAAYAEQLDRLGVPVSPDVVLILGDGSRSRHRLADIAPVFRARRARLHELLLERAVAVGSDGARESADPIAWGTAGVAACGRCEVCAPEVDRVRDPLLIAGIRRTQRDRLVAAGLDTIDRIADALPGIEEGRVEVAGISRAVLERLAGQARAQADAVPGAAPPLQVVNAGELAAIPPPNPGDLFFDFEGDPLFREPVDGNGARWGLDYLFGMVDAQERFTPLWAHSLEDERRALERFLALVAERRRAFPGMRIYHYAPYERAHLLSIAARHGTGETEVDRLLREHVLVDLYPIVRRALRIGSRSYSIKKLEPLYMGDELRDETGVTTGAQSVAEYAEASALLASDDPGRRAEGQRRLDAIADYNRYDCVSTLRLRDWLLRIAAEHGIPPTSPSGSPEPEDGPELELSTVAAALTMHASLAEDPRDRRAAAIAGSAIDYYQREQKSFWWAHFARLVDPIEDWADTRDVMVVDGGTSSVDDDWRAPEGRQRKHRRELRLRGEIAPGSSLKEGSEAYLVYDYPPPFDPQPGAAPGARATRLVRILERREDGVTVQETRDGAAPSYDRLPVALTPGPPPRPGAQKPAIEEWGRALAASLDDGYFLADPVVDLMRRVPPRLRRGDPLV
ncbi:MAG: TM0106 family RecB-like putative nuclease, partial [Leucobacter sp.]